LPEEARGKICCDAQDQPVPTKTEAQTVHERLLFLYNERRISNARLNRRPQGTVGTAQSPPIGRQKPSADRTEAAIEACCLFAKHLSPLWVRC
jgi:hypothetical protein